MCYDNLSCIKIRVSREKKNGKGMNVLNDNLTDAANVDIWHYYTHTKRC